MHRMLKRAILTGAILVAFVLAASAQIGNLFSGGRGAGQSLLNFGIVGAGEYAFLNWFKGCISRNSAVPGYAFPLVLNNDGYPQSTPTQGVQCVVVLPTNSNPSWVISWSGTARFSIAPGSGGVINTTTGAGFIVSGGTNAITYGGTDGRVVFNFATAGSIQILFTWSNAGTFSGASDIKLVREDEESLLTAGEIFRPDFLSALRAVNPRILRFASWSGVEANSMSSRWAYRTPVTSFTYSSTAWFTGALLATACAGGGGITGTDTYSGAAAPDTPVTYTDGEMYQGQICNANTSLTGLTLDVGGRGAKTLVNNALTNGGSGVTVGSLSANGLFTFIYDGVLDKWLVTSNGVFQALVGGSNSGVPPEVMIALCNKLKVDCWLNIPPLADDDYTTQLVTLAASTLTGGKLYLEFSNEIWNAGFAQTPWAVARGAVVGFQSANSRRFEGYYALRVRQVMGLATTAWGSRSASELRRVMAFQAYGSTTNTNTYRFTGADLLPWNGVNGATNYSTYAAANYNTAPNQPINYVDILSYGPYWSGAQMSKGDGLGTDPNAGPGVAGYQNSMTQALTAADDYASGDPTRMASALAFMDSDSRAGIRNGGLGAQTMSYQNTTVYPAWNTLAVTHDKRVVQYENGYEVVEPTAARLTELATAGSYTTCQSGVAATCSTAFANLIAAYKNTDAFRQLVNDDYRNFMAQTRSLHPAWYLWIRKTTPITQWAMYPGDLYSTPYRSFNAVANFNAAP